QGHNADGGPKGIEQQQNPQCDGQQAEQQHHPPFVPAALGQVQGGADAAAPVKQNEDAEHHRQEAGHHLGLCQRKQAQRGGDDAAYQQKGSGKAAAADAHILDQADDAGKQYHGSEGITDPQQAGLRHNKQQ